MPQMQALSMVPLRKGGRPRAFRNDWSFRAKTLEIAIRNKEAQIRGFGGESKTHRRDLALLYGQRKNLDEEIGAEIDRQRQLVRSGAVDAVQGRARLDELVKQRDWRKNLPATATKPVPAAKPLFRTVADDVLEASQQAKTYRAKTLPSIKPPDAKPGESIGDRAMRTASYYQTILPELKKAGATGLVAEANRQIAGAMAIAHRHFSKEAEQANANLADYDFDLERSTGKILAAPGEIRRAASQGISDLFGLGQIDWEEIEKNDPASRISGKLADMVPYFVPGVGPVLVATQFLNTVASVQKHGLKETAQRLVDDSNPFLPDLPMEDRVFRTFGILATAFGGLKKGMALKSLLKNEGAAVWALAKAGRVSKAQAARMLLEAKTWADANPQEVVGRSKFRDLTEDPATSLPRSERKGAAEPPPRRRVSGLDRLLKGAVEAGALKGPEAVAAARALWRAVAREWARRHHSHEEHFYARFQDASPLPMPKGALKQEGVPSGRLPMANWSDVEWLLNGDAPIISFTQADLAHTGQLTFPDGTQLMAYGGPGTRLEGIDLSRRDNFGWLSGSEEAAERHLRRARDGAELQFVLSNRPDNVLKSHGALAVKAVLERAVREGQIDPELLLRHLQSVADRYNARRGLESMRLPDIRSIDDFVEAIDRVDSLERRNDLARLMFPKAGRSRKGMLLGMNYDQVAEALTEPEFRNIGANRIVGAIQVDPSGRVGKTSTHPAYKYGVPGKNLGRTLETDPWKLLPESYYQDAKESLERSGKRPSDAQITNHAFNPIRLPGREWSFAKGGLYRTTIERLRQFFYQVDPKGEAKGWTHFGKGERATIGFIAGKADFSTFVHESFHAWTHSLPAEAQLVLEKHFGEKGSVEYYERSARAFERYLREGIAPTPELRTAFRYIKDQMVEIYRRLKGSPLEHEIHPEVREVFDRMLGGGSEPQTRSAQKGSASARPDRGAGAPLRRRV